MNANARIEVPSFEGRALDDAVAVARARDLVVRLAAVPPVEQVDEGFSTYVVREQAPAAGSLVSAGSTVSVTVEPVFNAAGQTLERPAEVVIPDVVGLPVERAIGLLADAGVLVTVRATADASTGYVGSQSLAAGTTVPGATEIVLTLASG